MEKRNRKEPGYLLILGDMDQISLATQRALAVDGVPGRLVCDNEGGYAAYADKVCRWERAEPLDYLARTLLYTVHDGTEATRAGYDNLMRRCFEKCEKERVENWREFRASTVEDCGDRYRPNPDELLDLAAVEKPSLLLSMSHGMGPPRRRDWKDHEKRELQGAMCFGHEEPITGRDIESGLFLPGGLWLYFACFGAGTPSTSAFERWLKMLHEDGMEGLGPLQSVIAGLAKGHGFTSGIAQGALANPDGPLGILGHIDLAWSYSYEELRVEGDKRVTGSNRSSTFFKLLAKLTCRERMGAAFLELIQDIHKVGYELTERYDRCKERGIDPEGATAAERLDLGNMWMLRQDLLGFVLLGDPAVRLPLLAEKPSEPSEREVRFQRGLFGMRPAGDPPSSDAAAESDEEPTPAVAPAHRQGPDIARIEKAILGLASGYRTVEEVASELDISIARAKRYQKVYCDAGRTALDDYLAPDETD